MIRFSILFATTLLITACASMPSTGSSRVVNSWDIDATYDEVWSATLAVLDELDIPVQEADEGGARIVSKRFSVRTGRDWAICTPRHWGELEVLFSPGSTRTRLEVNVRFRTGTPVNEFDSRRCPTTGNLERTIARRVIERTRPEDA